MPPSSAIQMIQMILTLKCRFLTLSSPSVSPTSPSLYTDDVQKAIEEIDENSPCTWIYIMISQPKSSGIRQCRANLSLILPYLPYLALGGISRRRQDSFSPTQRPDLIISPIHKKGTKGSRADPARLNTALSSSLTSHVTKIFERIMRLRDKIVSHLPLDLK